MDRINLVCSIRVCGKFCIPHRFWRMSLRIIWWYSWDKVALIKLHKFSFHYRTVAEDHDLGLMFVNSCACGNLIPSFLSVEYTILSIIKSSKVFINCKARLNNITKPRNKFVVENNSHRCIQLTVHYTCGSYHEKVTLKIFLFYYFFFLNITGYVFV